MEIFGVGVVFVGVWEWGDPVPVLSVTTSRSMPSGWSSNFSSSDRVGLTPSVIWDWEKITGFEAKTDLGLEQADFGVQTCGFWVEGVNFEFKYVVVGSNRRILGSKN